MATTPAGVATCDCGAAAAPATGVVWKGAEGRALAAVLGYREAGVCDHLRAARGTRQGRHGRVGPYRPLEAAQQLGSCRMI